MKIEKCLADYWQVNPDVPRLLQINQEQLKSYIEKGVVGNSMLFFKIAAVLETVGYVVDGYSNLPESNRTTIRILLSEKATIEDYLNETHLSRDAFGRNLRGSRFLGENGQRLIAKANAMFISGIKSEIKKSESGRNSGLKPETVFSAETINHDRVFNLIVAAAANAFTLEKELDNYLAVSTEGERKNLRDNLARTNFALFASSNVVHRLSQKLNALCSEKALENYRLNQKKGGK